MSNEQTSFDFGDGSPPIKVAPRPKRRSKRRLSKVQLAEIAKENVRRHGTREAILLRLRQGPATNIELSAIALRFGGRLHELRKQGYAIETSQDSGGLFVYTLKGASC